MSDPRRNPKSYRRRINIEGPWLPRSKELLESPAYRVLSRAAYQVLSRLEIEHLKHGGYENGKLPVTYDQFVEYGLHRHSIAPALRELDAVRLIEVTESGSSGNGEWRRPNKFRLTYLSVGRADPTNEWRHIKTITEARSLIKAGRHRQKPLRKKNKRPVPVSANSQCRFLPIPDAGNHHQELKFPSKLPVPETPSLLLYLGSHQDIAHQQHRLLCPFPSGRATGLSSGRPIARGCCLERPQQPRHSLGLAQ
jgi:hypothetical protein